MSFSAPLEIWMLLAASLLGALQGLGGAKAAQIQRNYSETFFIFGTAIVALLVLDGFGDWSREGAAVYVAGRIFYTGTTLAGATPLRKWTWAVSMVGLVGCLGQLARQLYLLIA